MMTGGTRSSCRALLNVSTVPLSEESFDAREGKHSGIGLSWECITCERNTVRVILFSLYELPAMLNTTAHLFVVSFFATF